MGSDRLSLGPGADQVDKLGHVDQADGDHGQEGLGVEVRHRLIVRVIVVAAAARACGLGVDFLVDIRGRGRGRGGTNKFVVCHLGTWRARLLGSCVLCPRRHFSFLLLLLGLYYDLCPTVFSLSLHCHLLYHTVESLVKCGTSCGKKGGDEQDATTTRGKRDCATGADRRKRMDKKTRK